MSLFSVVNKKIEMFEWNLGKNFDFFLFKEFCETNLILKFIELNRCCRNFQACNAPQERVERDI